jgi:hypothetical protein
VSGSEAEEEVCNRLGAVRVSFEFKRDSGAETGFSRGINRGKPVRNGAQKQRVELRIKEEAQKECQTS